MTRRYKNIKETIIGEKVEKQFSTKYSMKEVAENLRPIALLAFVLLLISVAIVEILAILLLLKKEISGIAIGASVTVMIICSFMLTRPFDKLYKREHMIDYESKKAKHYDMYKSRIIEILEENHITTLKGTEYLQSEASELIEKNRPPKFGESKIENILFWGSLTAAVSLLIGERTIENPNILTTVLVIGLAISIFVFGNKLLKNKLVYKTDADQQIFNLLQEAKYIMCEKEEKGAAKQ